MFGFTQFQFLVFLKIGSKVYSIFFCLLPVTKSFYVMSSLNNSLSNLGISNHKFAQELYPQIHSHSYYEQSLMVKQIILIYIFRKKISVVQLWSHVWLFATPWTAIRQSSLSFTVSQTCSLSWWYHPTISFSVIPCHPLLLPSIFTSIRVFSKED